MLNNSKKSKVLLIGDDLFVVFELNSVAIINKTMVERYSGGGK
jgi:hypothetical protein